MKKKETEKSRKYVIFTYKIQKKKKMKKSFFSR